MYAYATYRRVKRIIDTEKLADLWRRGIPAPRIAEIMDVKVDSIYKKAHRMGLPCRVPGIRSLLDKDPEKKKWFIRNYPEMSNETIGVYLGLSPDHISRIARKMGLRKSERYWEGIKEYHKKRVRQYWNGKINGK